LLASVKNFFIDKRWAFAAILIGIAVGFLSAVICVRWNLVIFGFNIMFIVSPLIAGFVETFIARRKYGKSTGAISALLIFLLINAYAWVFPKDPIVINLFTLGGLALMFQAAFPILVNYLLFVVFLGALTWLIGYLGNLLSKATDKVLRKTPELEGTEDMAGVAEEGFLDELTVPLLTVPGIKGEKISEHMGLVTGEAVVEEESKGLSKISKQLQMDDMNLDKAKNMAISRMFEDAKAMGANRVIEVSIDYNSIGGLKGSALIVTATGTAVLYK
jgi:uncharacterized protein YbjQ (UPF0145 family)